MILQWIAIWSVLGFIVLLILPVPKDRVVSTLYLVALGPICWIMFPFGVLQWYLREKKGFKND